MSHGEDHHELDDGRKVGEWKTRFCAAAWVQISIELIYLITLLCLGIAVLVDGALWSEPSGIDQAEFIVSNLTGLRLSVDGANWVALAIAGMIGGIVFDLKWLYHSVGRGIWNQDRILWRLIVPFNSAMVSLFTGYLFASGVVPFLRNEDFREVYTLLGFGFVFGYFSDNILASMQKIAQKIFGTLSSDS
ncbi:hypothetical protein [Thalassospira sp.]|uniref:hypothetical protein n=1 Tax=Thalassospira sp. TaxID=1912094 RepID=UPI00273743E8|nr:hypothetical protein [Thalassospira sp.]MDP2698699.1 hypothetical protein [Thalassospira sp.]